MDRFQPRQRHGEEGQENETTRMKTADIAA
jgi:hypothetical protein